MATATTKIPADSRSIRLDPDLAAALEKELASMSGAKLEKAQAAVLKVRRSGVTGSFARLLDVYRGAIKDATK